MAANFSLDGGRPTSTRIKSKCKDLVDGQQRWSQRSLNTFRHLWES